jgi:protein-disulfide isomerase
MTSTKDTSQPRHQRHLTALIAGSLVAVLAVLGIWALPMDSGPAVADDMPGEALTAEQSEEVLRLFKRYLSDHPEDIVKSLESYAAKEDKARRDGVRETLADDRDDIERDEGSFVGGNPDGDVSVVEFFDYRCSYCKKTHDTVQQLLKDDGNIRFVYKEFPILGPDSVLASRAALAAREQNMYVELHNALMSARGKLDREQVLEIADDVGVDVAQLEIDMKAPKVEKIINRNHALAQRLNIGGTPAFIIGDQLLAGAAEMSRFKALVEQARTDCTSC